MTSKSGKLSSNSPRRIADGLADFGGAGDVIRSLPQKGHGYSKICLAHHTHGYECFGGGFGFFDAIAVVTPQD